MSSRASISSTLVFLYFLVFSVSIVSVISTAPQQGFSIGDVVRLDQKVSSKTSSKSAPLQDSAVVVDAQGDAGGHRDILTVQPHRGPPREVSAPTLTLLAPDETKQTHTVVAFWSTPSDIKKKIPVVSVPGFPSDWRKTRHFLQQKLGWTNPATLGGVEHRHKKKRSVPCWVLHYLHLRF